MTPDEVNALPERVEIERLLADAESCIDSYVGDVPSATVAMLCRTWLVAQAAPVGEVGIMIQGSQLPPALTHELCRWGQPYWCRGTRGGCIKNAEYTAQRPWWWLRILGWHVRDIRTQGEGK